MRRRKRSNAQIKKIGILLVALLLTLGLSGFAYSHWSTTLHLIGTITTGTWEKACVRIMKTLNGSFTDPYTGADLTTPTNLIAIASELFPTKFQLIIVVENCGSVNITDMVTDVVENNVAPINWTASKGTVSWVNVIHPSGFVHNFLYWTIGTLVPSERATLEIWIETLPNPAGKYEPTSEPQYDFEINRGANITASSELGDLQAKTEAITLDILPYGDPDGIGLISPTLPYSTPWAEDKINAP